MQTRIVESGLYVDPPEGYFRFQDIPYFKENFKRFGLCEMDFGWWDADRGRLILLELKDYSKNAIPPDLVDDLVQKATDSLLVLGSVYYGLPHAEGIKAMLPERCQTRPTEPDSLRLYFVLKTNPDHAYELMGMLDKLRNKLKGRLELLDLRRCTSVFLLNHATAQAQGIPLENADATQGSTEPRPKGKKRR